MFHFNFDVDDRADDIAFADLSAEPTHQEATDSAVLALQQPFSEVDLESLLDALPTQISYSFISPPPSEGHVPGLKIARRDLFDARFQLISEGTGDPASGGQGLDGPDPGLDSSLQFIDNPSDLVPFVYEGGLKTWECSLDLASCLKRDGHTANARGQRILELGCGTAIPTLCILQDMFTFPISGNAETHVHLQDYNTSVLKLVTLPNIILAWYTSPDADVYRSANPDASQNTDSELLITSELVAAFKAALCAHRLHLRFFAGSWDTFDFARTGGSYHLVLSSETIYHPESLPSLVHVLREACWGGDNGEGKDAVCLVAGKTVYFGVGGGVTEFVRSVESIAGERGNRGRVETIWEKVTGVRRSVMRVQWT